MYTIVAVGEELRGNLMDIELFQWVLLGLLGLGIIVLVALLATLGGIKKALEQRASTPTASEAFAPQQATESATDHPAAQAGPAEQDTSPRADDAPRETATATPGATAASTGQAGSIRSVLEQHGLSETESQPAGGQAAAAEPEETHLVDSVFAAHADDPQEEPFQREGRWWFRRGDELLLYDEASGQWQPAPEGSAEAAGVAPAATGATASGGGTPTETGVQTTPVSAQPAVADQVATFWKCPTCGAVNGSTAATCRMCFAARP